MPDVNGLEGAQVQVIGRSAQGFIENTQVQDWAHSWHRHQCLLPRGCTSDFQQSQNQIITKNLNSILLRKTLNSFQFDFFILRRWQLLSWMGSLGHSPLNLIILSEKTNSFVWSYFQLSQQDNVDWKDKLTKRQSVWSYPLLGLSTWWSTQNGALLGTMGNLIMSKPNGTKR